LSDSSITVEGEVSSGISRLEWDWGDGIKEERSFPASHSYSAYGDYTVRVTAYLSNGLSSSQVLNTGTLTISPQNTKPAVALMVDPLLLDGIRIKLTQFEADLAKEGYIVTEQRANFVTPPEIRDYLSQLYTQTNQHLAGTILIGKIPYGYQWVKSESSNPSIPPTLEEVISFQYYADLDGTFGASTGYKSPGNHQYSFDLHTGDIDWEIWVGVLPYYKGNQQATVDALNRYFAKNHAYRTGQYSIPRRFLEITEHSSAKTQAEHDQIMAGLKNGPYSWTPFSTDPNALFYFNSPSGGLTVDQGYAALRQGVADFMVVDAHGYWGASGKIDIKWVEGGPVKAVFFWSNGCAVGNLDYADNFLASMLYSPTSEVLIARGSTNDSGGMGNNSNGFFGHNIATALIQSLSFGEALLSHTNVPLISPWSKSAEFHLAPNVILGDPTLKLR
jgi:hypothetical protein